MQSPLQITIRDISQSEALETQIREKVEKLEHFYPRITGCHVTIEMPHKHRHRGRLFNVRLEVQVPGSDLVINRDLSEDVYVALRDAFDAAKRKLEDYARVQRRNTKHHQEKIPDVAE